MAENKEKILINIEQSNYDGVFGFGAGAKVWQCTKSEAIETMAKAFFPWDFFPHEIEEGKGWNDLNEWQKGKYLKWAEAALNALLDMDAPKDNKN